VHDPECDTRIRAELDAATPFIRWLADHVGPSHRQE
jgi:hypothetical protein